MEAHLALHVAAGGGYGQRFVDAFGALARKRQPEPERHRSDRNRDAGRGIAGRRECPIERRAHVVDQMPMALQPLCCRPGLPIDLRLLERAPVIFGVSPRDAVALAAFLELRQGIGPRDVEQPVKGDRAVDVGRDERLGNEVGDRPRRSPPRRMSACARTAIAASIVNAPTNVASRCSTSRSISESWE